MAEPRYFDPQDAKPQERAVLVGTVFRNDDRDEEEENLQELAQLGRAAGARVLHALVQERNAPSVSTYIGRGKVEELAALCKEREANLIIFDSELSPVQARNLEKRTEINVCDRTELILDIFARRARTRQARLQVELAQLEYLRPRLRRMWEHLSRQEGGIGTRGPGETQLEVDRRRLGDRVSQLKRELDKVARVSETKARQRRGRGFSVALVGYTNVGKSSLLNALTGADAYVADALFATLDSTTRRLDLDGSEPVLVTDTVGFVRKLPHHLVESFKATLAEVSEADLVLHVIDLASASWERQVLAVEEVLGDLDVDPERCLRVFNKLDAARDADEVLAGLRTRWPDACFVSATTGEGLEALRGAIRARRQEAFRETVLFLPAGGEALTAAIYAECEVRDVRYEPEGSYYRLRLAEPTRARLLARGGEEHAELLDGWDADAPNGNEAP